jgi:hypothetical protein
MAGMQFQFTKAARHAVKLKIGIDGPSGSGKTYGALALAYGITNGGRIAVGDSENNSAALYADRFEFDSLVIPNAEPETYKAIIDAAVDARYDALVIDSLSHAWLYILAAKEDYDRANPKSNQWTNWRVFGAKWEKLMAHVLAAPIHIIATMRSKQAYEQVDTGGKKQVIKLGLQPQVREGAEYEFGIVFSVNQAHRAEATKDRTQLFTDRLVDLAAPELHTELVGWMNAGGAAPEPAPRPQLHRDEEAPVAAAASPEHTVEWAKAFLFPFKKSPSFGKPLSTFSVVGLESLETWILEKRTENNNPQLHGELLTAIKILIADTESWQEALPLGGDEEDAPSTAESGANPSELAPGKIEDAIKPAEGKEPVRPPRGAGRRAAAPSPATPTTDSTAASGTGAATTEGGTAVAAAPPMTLGGLSRRIGELLQHEKFSEEERAKFRARLDGADSIEAMQFLVTELQNIVDLPF